MKVLRKDPPYLARVDFLGFAITPPDAQPLQRNALRVEHAEHIVVGCDEQRGRVTEILVGRKPLRIGMAVRRYDGQI